MDRATADALRALLSEIRRTRSEIDGLERKVDDVIQGIRLVLAEVRS